MRVGRWILLVLVSAVAALAWLGTAAAAPAEPGLGLAVAAAHPTFAAGAPVTLIATVTNATGAACGLTKSNLGAVQVTQVTRAGRSLTPVMGSSFIEDGIGSAAAQALVSVPSGGTVSIPVTGYRIHPGTDAGSVVLRSTVPTDDGDGLDTLWPIGTPGRYVVTADYAVPDLGGAPGAGTVCAGSTADATVTFTIGKASGGSAGLRRWIYIAGAAVLLIVVVALVVWLLLRRRHRVSAAVLLILVALIAIPGTSARPAWADYVIDPDGGLPSPGFDLQGAVNTCFAEYLKPNGDPDHLLPLLLDKSTPTVRIVQVSGDTASNTFRTFTGPYGKGSSTIAWNATNTEPYADGVARNPCAALYHEMSHAKDFADGTVPKGMCDDTGIPTAEVKATFAENRYRAAMGLPLRTQYNENKLPKSLDDCKKPPTKKKKPTKGPTRLCDEGCGVTNGDPHLVTFDRSFYDFQAVGEFDLVRATGGDPLEIQTRQEPVVNSRTVSLNTAVAFRAGAHRVMLQLVGGATEVRVDGAVVAVGRGDRALPGGGTLTRRASDLGPADGYDVTWPDGSSAAVDPIGIWGYRLLVNLAPARAGHVVGLLGNDNGDPTDDFTTPDGKAYTAPMTFAQLYPGYADAWRITGATSLFTYPAGQSTATFTDRAFPSKPMTTTDLTAAQRDAAAQVCAFAGVSDPWQLNECVFDVAATNRPEFATADSATEATAPPVGAPIAAPTLATGTISADGADQLAFDGTKGEAVYVDLTAAATLNRCSPYELVSPSGTTLRTGCSIGGVGEIDRTVLPEDGRYIVRADPSAGLSGHVAVAVYQSRDVTGTLIPNGATVTGDLTEPGSIATYTFAGTAGQRVYLDVTDATLPNECVILILSGPDGVELSTGCIIDGTGEIDGELLASDGTYTITVDPGDANIGSLSMRLYASTDQTGPIAANGPSVTATIGRPGGISEFRFDGTAGETVSVAATGSTLPDECGLLSLQTATGQVVLTGCVIQGTGSIEPTTLPASGPYTIVIDPYADATGSVTLTLHDK